MNFGPTFQWSEPRASVVRRSGLKIEPVGLNPGDALQSAPFGGIQSYLQSLYKRVKMADTIKQDNAQNTEQSDLKEDTKHVLEHPWTLWYDVGTQGRQNQQQFGQALRAVYTFSTVEDFWW